MAPLGIQPAQYAYRNRFESQLGYRLRLKEQSVKPLDRPSGSFLPRTPEAVRPIGPCFVLVKANNFARLREQHDVAITVDNINANQWIIVT